MPLPARPLWTAKEIAKWTEKRNRHPLNRNSEVYVRRLSAGAGLKRAVLSLARVPPAKESFIYHSHERDEEFLYICRAAELPKSATLCLKSDPATSSASRRPDLPII
jgi:hypothetical protein